MFETRLEVVLWMGIAAMGIGVFASIEKAEEWQGPVARNSNPPAESRRGLTWDQEVLPTAATEEAKAPPSTIPCNAGEPAGRNIDPGAEAAPVPDPYAG